MNVSGPWRRALVLVCMLFCAAGCRGPHPDALDDRPADTDPQRRYTSAFRTWTREDRIYSGLALKLIVNATFRSPAFRQAYSNAYAEIYRLPPTEGRKFWADQQRAAGAYHDFVVAAFVPDKQWDDFAEKDSIWRIALVVKDGRRIQPLEIRKLDKRDAVIQHFYPYASPWKSIYQVRFPVSFPTTGERILSEPPRDFRLMVVSVHGSAEMEW